MAHGASSDTHGVSLRAIFFPLDWLKLKKVAKIADFDAPEGVKFSNETQNLHENSQWYTFRPLKKDCDTFELSFDMRCKEETFAHRLTCIAALYDKKWLSYAPPEPSHHGLKTRQKTRKRCVFFEKNAKNVKITPIEYVSTIKNGL